MFLVVEIPFPSNLPSIPRQMRCRCSISSTPIVLFSTAAGVIVLQFKVDGSKEPHSMMCLIYRDCQMTIDQIMLATCSRVLTATPMRGATMRFFQVQSH